MAWKIKLAYNRLPQIARKAELATSAIVRKAALDVEAQAKAIVPVDTGTLKNSIQTEFPGRTRAIIAPHTEYESYVEFGTRGRKGKPYMRPAAEKVRPSFIEALRRLEERLG